MSFAHLRTPFPSASNPWFALRVVPRHERSCATHLASRGIEHFVPLCATRRCWSDRIKTIDEPLFPGYVFARFAPSERLHVVTTPGIRSIVSFGSIPAPIPDSEIEAVRRIIDSSLPFGPWPYLRPGSKVRIAAGCMTGLEGTLVSTHAGHRVVVNVELLQRSVAVEIDQAFIAA